MFGFRYSLMLVCVVLGITVVPGVFLGLVAGYYVNTKLSNAIMRLADIFVAVPALLLALASRVIAHSQRHKRDDGSLSCLVAVVYQTRLQLGVIDQERGFCEGGGAGWREPIPHNVQGDTSPTCSVQF